MDIRRYRNSITEHPEGSIVLYSDHTAIVESLQARIKELEAAQGEPVAPPVNARCSEDLRIAGKPYPRTCYACGLGPCKKVLGKPAIPDTTGGGTL